MPLDSEVDYWADLAKGTHAVLRKGGERIPKAEDARVEHLRSARSLSGLKRLCAYNLEPIRAMYSPHEYKEIPVASVRDYLVKLDGPRRERAIRSIIGGRPIRTRDQYEMSMEFVEAALQSGGDVSEIEAVNAALRAFEARAAKKSSKS